MKTNMNPSKTTFSGRFLLIFANLCKMVFFDLLCRNSSFWVAGVFIADFYLFLSIFLGKIINSSIIDRQDHQKPGFPTDFTLKIVLFHCMFNWPYFYQRNMRFWNIFY